VIEKIDAANVKKVLKDILPERDVKEIIDRGEWIRRIFELRFEDGSCAFMKINLVPDYLDSTRHDVQLSEIFAQNGLPAPETLYFDDGGKVLGSPFLIQTQLGGKRLSHWLKTLPEKTWPQLFTAAGETYAKIHAIKGPASGLWLDSPEKTLPVSPNDFYLREEILNGSGKKVFESGLISEKTYHKIISLWEKNLPDLKDHQPSLVHGSPFPWTICLSEEGGHWQVTRLNAMGDFLWWDPAYDLALLRYPPSYEWPEACWDAFSSAYGALPEIWRINLYAVLQHLCDLNDVFMPPAEDTYGKTSRKATVDRLEMILSSFELG
jgi:hypothetical protein